ncbi:MAG: peptidoglycan DD-metalloendopeptidase family protein [Clostridia bacterium]|nr:peptidoglycan DD-metalloendopeptidase family protein [Clostridia bacterium]MBQ1896143.1 peptidoglycan DD-metalloendopeptidase family protein [Clostridia bacterium]MBQ2091680.1 peptidoglycan DD-metalloendopeptidase family protein [Clostridia bacterium]
MTMSKRIVSLFLALLFCLALVTPAFAAGDKVAEDDPRIIEMKSKIEGLKREAAEAKQKRQDLEGQINEARASAMEVQSQVNALQAEINAYQAEINALNTQIGLIQQQLDENEEAMEDQKLQIEATRELLGQRLRAMYMAGNVSTIEIVFEADSFENLLNRIELVTRITKHDQQIITDLKNDIKELEALQVKLEEDRVDLQASKDEVVASQAEIKEAKKSVDAKLAVLEAYLAKLNREDAQLKEIEAQAEAQKAAYAATIYAMINGTASEGDGSASLICPVPYGSAYVSSSYGPRTLGSKTSFHYGLDISMPGAMDMDKRIVAAGAGTVLISSNGCSHNYKKYSSCGCNGGYGNYCVIDHGNGVIAFYAHLTTSYVSAGQVVNQGDTIGIMGCTGYSTGAHLHFEIRTNLSGARSATNVNPANYIHVP